MSNKFLTPKTVVVAALAGLISVGLAAGAAAADERGKRFERMDTDGNGSLSYEEFSANSEGRVERMDTNGDGRITKDEFVTFRGERAFERRGRMFDKLDTNGDGEITEAEREEHQRTRFDKVDINGDGEVTQEEAREARRRFAEAKRKLREERQ